MKIREKLKKTGRRATIAYSVMLISSIYLLMTVVKGVYLGTIGSSLGPASKAKLGMGWIIQNTYFFPLSIIWEKIPSIPFESGDALSFYKVIIPPLIVAMICIFYISDHRSLKTKYYELKAEIEKEIALGEMREEAGIRTVSNTSTVDITISNTTNSDPLWHDRWWGKIAIGVAIALILSAIGIG